MKKLRLNLLTFTKVSKTPNGNNAVNIKEKFNHKYIARQETMVMAIAGKISKQYRKRKCI